MSSMSFKEKSAWGTLICLLIIGALYFSSVVEHWHADQLHMATTFGLAMRFIIMLTVVLAGYHIIVSAVSGTEDEDERDRLIGWRAGNTSGNVLGVGVVGVVLSVFIGDKFGNPLWQQPAIIVNALMLGVFLSMVVELALTIWFHRKGI